MKKLFEFLSKIGGPLVWFGIPTFLIITYNLAFTDIHPLLLALWCVVMAGAIGYSLGDDGVFKARKD